MTSPPPWMDMRIQKDVQELYGPMGLFQRTTAPDPMVVFPIFQDFHGGQSAAKWRMANVYRSKMFCKIPD